MGLRQSGTSREEGDCRRGRLRVSRRGGPISLDKLPGAESGRARRGRPPQSPEIEEEEHKGRMEGEGVGLSSERKNAAPYKDLEKEDPGKGISDPTTRGITKRKRR